jgi:hypothetical protein
MLLGLIQTAAPQGGGHASGLFLVVGAIVVLSAIVSWRSKSFSSFVPVLVGLLVLFAISVLGVEQALRLHWLPGGVNRLMVAVAVFCALLLGLYVFSAVVRRKRPGA